MISVIVYGRNDAYGYNLHKRAAISLNCIAEVLSHPEDEILFVDYNTPNALPTFIEAIYDTLTPRAKSRLRVFRVRPELHARLVDRTHVLALEPHSQNIALRRSNPRNRWILFTNPDMIFIPRGGVRDLDSAVYDLPDGLYVLPRFGLPEPVWEAFPRTDATAILRACEELGPKLHLDDVTTSNSYMGDFQLAPRQALFDIRGFDERMIHGRHAGANLCKRLNLFYGGRTESLAHRLKGYHCVHTRVPELRADITLQNDFEEFVNRVDQPVAISQDETWGAPGEPIEEVDFADGAQARFVPAMERALGGPQTVEYQSNAQDLRNFVYYQPEHALPYLAASLTTYPRDARFAYVGNNPRMLHLVVRSIAELRFTQPLRYGAAGTADLLSGHTLLIFDFGLDPNGLNLSAAPRVSDWPRELRYSLGNTARLLENCVEECQALWESQQPIPEFLVLNAQHHVFKKFVEQFLVTPETPYTTHVRKGWPRVGDERLYRSHSWKDTQECMRSFFGYETAGTEPNHLDASQPIDLTSLTRSAAYKDGNWGRMDLTGTWTDGSDASILFSPPSPDEDLLAYVRIVETCTGPGLEPIRIQVLLEDEPIVRWVVEVRYAASSFKVLLPGRLMARKQICRLTFHIEGPRESGVKVQRVTFAPTERLRYRIGESVDFRDSGTGGFHLDECWTEPDGYGAWTLGPAASLDLFLAETVDGPLYAVFAVTDAAVNEEHPLVNVAVFFNQREAGSWKLDNRGSAEFRILVPAEVLREKNPVNVSFRIETPRSPLELKWSANDMRPLGFRLTGVQLRTADRIEHRWNPISAGLRRLLRVAAAPSPTVKTPPLKLDPNIESLLQPFLDQSAPTRSLVAVECRDILGLEPGIGPRQEAVLLRLEAGESSRPMVIAQGEGELGLSSLARQARELSSSVPGNDLLVLPAQVLNELIPLVDEDFSFRAVAALFQDLPDPSDWKLRRSLFDRGLVCVGSVPVAGWKALCFLASDDVRSFNHLHVESRGHVSMSVLVAAQFGNRLFRYACAKLYALRHGLTPTFPAWEGNHLFGLEDKSCEGLELPKMVYPPFADNERDIWEQDDPPINIDLEGYFQELPECWRRHRPLLRLLFQLPPKHLEAIEAWRHKVTDGGRRTLVAVHVRRGDYRSLQDNPHFRLVPEGWYLDWLRSIWPSLCEPILFVGTDEPDAILPQFREFETVSAKFGRIGRKLPDHVRDFEVMRRVDYLAICNSSFSRMAAILAPSSQKCFLPSFQMQSFQPYEPWMDPAFWVRFAEAERGAELRGGK